MNKALSELIEYYKNNEFVNESGPVGVSARVAALFATMPDYGFHHAANAFLDLLQDRVHSDGPVPILKALEEDLALARRLIELMPELSHLIRFTDLPEGTREEVVPGRICEVTALAVFNPDLCQEERQEVIRYIQENYNPIVER